MFGKIDLNDADVSPFFVLASGVNAELFELNLMGVNFADPLWTFGGNASVALATLGLVIAPPFSPPIQDILTGSQVVGLVALVVQAGGFYSLSYLG